MSLKDFRHGYYEHTRKVSESVTKLAFAGIAIVWLFRAGEGLDSKLPESLLLPVLLFAATLGLDLLHYLVGAITWGTFCRLQERKGVSEEADLDAPAWLNWGTNALFYLKVASVVLGYALMIRYLYGLWTRS